MLKLIEEWQETGSMVLNSYRLFVHLDRGLPLGLWPTCITTLPAARCHCGQFEFLYL